MSIMVFCRLAALVWYQFNQPGERVGTDSKRDLRVIHVPSDIHRRRVEFLEGPVEFGVTTVVNAGIRIYTSCDNRTAPGE